MATITAKMVSELRKTTGAGMMDCKKVLAETDGNFDEAIKLLREKGQAKAAKRLGNETTEGRVFSIVSDDHKKVAMVSMTCETEPVAGVEQFVEFGNKVINAVYNKEDLSAFDEALTEIRAGLGENITIKENTLVEGDYVENYIHTNKKVGVIVKLKLADVAKASEDAVKELGRNLALQVASLAPKSISREDLDPEFINSEKEILINQLKEDPKNKNKPENILEKIVEGRLGKLFSEACLLDQEYVKEKMTISELIDGVSKEVGTEISVDQFIRYYIGA
ncbi:MAG: translation elongation factor Ts [Candidatus Cloacimonadota bacterium]|nr:MAG: translation elongation factor Ts [Candidatus Cloacimonadota bacterium]PIE79472.1 MAG: translation elongation factor Ts [Candidatus Delongbacteria bacterium]